MSKFMQSTELADIKRYAQDVRKGFALGPRSRLLDTIDRLIAEIEQRDRLEAADALLAAAKQHKRDSEIPDTLRSIFG